MATQYKELTVWQKAMDLVMDVYQLTADSPDKEKFGLVGQLRRAAVSIPSNIAEGQGRLTLGEFKQFLGHARGSLYEVETQLLIAKRLKWVATDDFERLQDEINDVGRLLNGLIRSLKARG
jgi:four helix bundle protein